MVFKEVHFQNSVGTVEPAVLMTIFNSLKLQFIHIIFKNSVITKKMQTFFITKLNQLMQFKEIMTV
jgi:hypothetical protein